MKRLKKLRKQEEERRQRRREIRGSITFKGDPNAPRNTIIFPKSGTNIQFTDRAREITNSIFARENDAILNCAEFMSENNTFPTSNCSIQ